LTLTGSASAANLLEKLIGGTLSTVQTVTEPIINATSGFITPGSGPLGQTWIRLDGTYLQLTTGTTGYSASIDVNGVTRSYVVVRPDPAPPAAPMLFILHGNGGTAANMADLTEISQYVAVAGFWAVMPQAQNGIWNDDPSNSDDSDVQFISQLIDSLVAAGGIDATRVYASGMSNGGFMTDRLACELSAKIAAFGMDAATLRTTLQKVCAPAVQRPKVFILGTTDPIVPYNGYGALSNIESAAGAIGYWSAQQGCSSPSTTRLPVIVNDGTTIDLQTYARCTAADLRLYTVNGGGHAWPGGWQYLPVPVIGTTSQNLAASGAIWNFVSQYHL
jgi:polyhydroxybutyrate depolymerase